jgi:catechol 2,3-dioxygenase-like lactoylglutathione lyase family enzyme
MMPMEFHRGRLLDHVHLRVKDLQRSHDFYQTVLAILGFTLSPDTPHYFACDELFVSPAGDDPPTAAVHIALQTSSRAAVDEFHKAALAAGAIDNGAPGERDYHPGYYGAFVRDPDGNNIEAVYHGPNRRSADSVVVRPA